MTAAHTELRSTLVVQTALTLGRRTSRVALARSCPACGAAPAHWCYRGRRVVAGHLHPSRTGGGDTTHLDLAS